MDDFATAAILKRDDGCPSGYMRSGDWCYSIWSLVIRWVVLAICLIIALLAITCFILRRRRMRRARPAYAGGWIGQPPPQQPYNPQQQPYQPGTYPPPNDYYAGAGEQVPMPKYGQQPGPQSGYEAPPPQYSQAQYGVQPQYGVQQPEQSYQPPMGPPPAK